MTPDLAVVLVAIIGVIVPVLTLIVKFLQDRQIAHEARAARGVIAIAAAEASAAATAASAAATAASGAAALRARLAADAVEAVRVDLVTQNAGIAEKVDTVHALVNGRLTRALEMVDALLLLLLEHAPTDPRVITIIRGTQSNPLRPPIPPKEAPP